MQPKFIIGVDAYSDAENELEKEFIVHTEKPFFVGEIVEDENAFSGESIKIIYSEKCEKKEFDELMKLALRALDTYTYNSEILDRSIAGAVLGSKGGAVKSKAKSQAVRENGKKGGRPRKDKK